MRYNPSSMNIGNQRNSSTTESNISNREA